ncbi:response regulator [Nocardioides campestrisoli]|uniref:response regulator n=1 Tax=Nocardioides campestrisoli TaxID=2736757 RepID=UPI001CD5E7F0|nr:response regulator transcription factor [Nocardioides campestrisoli]
MDDVTPLDVVVVDDDPLVRSALSLMLGGRSRIRVVGEAADGQAGVALVERLRPHVVLMDIRMPVLNGLEATALLHARPDPPRVIVLTTFDADEHVVGAVAAGADGFLLKDTPPAQIVEAIHRVADGEAMLSPSATRALVTQVRAQAPDDRAGAARQRLASLTAREQDVALAVGAGLSNAEIARALHLSVATVKAHVSRLFEKLEVTNRVQIAILVHDAGLA